MGSKIVVVRYYIPQCQSEKQLRPQLPGITNPKSIGLDWGEGHPCISWRGITGTLADLFWQCPGGFWYGLLRQRSVCPGANYFLIPFLSSVVGSLQAGGNFGHREPLFD